MCRHYHKFSRPLFIRTNTVEVLLLLVYTTMPQQQGDANQKWPHLFSPLRHLEYCIFWLLLFLESNLSMAHLHKAHYRHNNRTVGWIILVQQKRSPNSRFPACYGKSSHWTWAAGGNQRDFSVARVANF